MKTKVPSTMTTRSYLKKLLDQNINIDNVSQKEQHSNDEQINHCSLREHQREPDKIDLHESIVTDLSKIFDQKNDLSDVTIRISGGERCFHLHRWILSFRSDYFRLMFHSNFRESHCDPIELDDDCNIIEKLLRYIYTGRIDYDNLHQLLCLWMAADKYLFQTLSETIQIHIIEYWLNNYTVVPLYRFAIYYSQSQLEQKAFQFMLNFGYQMIETRILLLMDVESLCRLLSDDRFNCLENNLMEFVLAYITYHNDSTCIQMEKFDEKQIPDKYRLTLEDIGIVTVDINADECSQNNANHKVQEIQKKLSIEEQICLLQCIRPELLLQLDQLLKSFLLIYDLRLIHLWKQINKLEEEETNNLQMKFNGNHNVRTCYPKTKEYIIHKNHPIEVNLEEKIYFNQIQLVNYLSVIYESKIHLEYSIDHINWKTVKVESMELQKTKKCLLLNLPTIVFGQYIRIPFHKDCGPSSHPKPKIKLSLDQKLIQINKF